MKRIVHMDAIGVRDLRTKNAQELAAHVENCYDRNIGESSLAAMRIA